MLIDEITSQKTFPGAGDIDDCWIVATWMGVKAIRPDIPKGTVTWMRGAAGDPDDGHSDGGNTAEIMRMCERMWPDVRVVETDPRPWDWLMGRLKAAPRPASIAVLSSAMPPGYRYGFGGPHQILIWWEDGHMWMANPLAKDGTKPMKVEPNRIRVAAMALNKRISGVLLPSKQEAQATRLRYTQIQMDAAVNAAVADYKDQVTKDKAEDAAIAAAIAGQLVLLTD